MKKHPQKSNTLRIALTIIISLIIITLIYVYTARQIQKTKGHLIGVWEEQNVASYTANILHLTEEGVYWNHDFISTAFSFDGSEVTFNQGGRQKRYQFDSSKNKLIDLNTHYHPEYRKVLTATATSDTYLTGR